MTVRRKRNAGPSGSGSHGSRDPMERFHDEWLGMVKPIDGLVVSKPALIEAQVARPDDKTLRDRIAKATAGARSPDAILDALIESGAADPHSRTVAGRFVIQPGAERRRSGSHYTPRSLTAPIVEKTLAPLLAALPRRAPKTSPVPVDATSLGPSSEDLLSLKICDRRLPDRQIAAHPWGKSLRHPQREQRVPFVDVGGEPAW
jgi:hypothetical protein